MNTLDVMNGEVAIVKATAFAACIMQSHGGGGVRPFSRTQTAGGLFDLAQCKGAWGPKL